jgi:hypothetical protein
MEQKLSDTRYCPFVELRHELDADGYSPCVVERVKPQHRPHAGFNEPAVLFNPAVPELTRADLHQIVPREIVLVVHAHEA